MKFRLLPIALFLLTFLVSFQLLQLFAMQSFNVMQVQGVFSPGTQIYFSNANGFHPVLKKTAVGNSVADTTESQTLNFQLDNRLVSKFQIDISHPGSEFKFST